MRQYQFQKIFLLTILCLTLIKADDPFANLELDNFSYCRTEEQYINHKLFTSVGEIQYYDLNDFIKGFNLTYELNHNSHDTGSTVYNIMDGVSSNGEEHKINQNDKYHITIANDHMFMETESSQSNFVELVSAIDKGDYAVRYGTSQKGYAVTYSTTIPLEFDSNVQCLEITLISETVAIVSCVFDHGGSTLQRFENHFYEISSDKSHQMNSQISENNYMLFKPFSMKARRYTPSNDYIANKQTYLIQAVPYDQAYGFAGNSYLNIYRYVNVDNAEIGYQNGKLQPNEPITAKNLKLAGGELVLADFDTLHDWIYVLDVLQGVLIFQYKANKIQNLRHYLNENQQRLRYGISVNMLGSQFSIVTAESNFMVEYITHIEAGEPKQGLSYVVEDIICGTVQIQANSDYIALQQGKMVTFYERGNVISSNQKGVIQDVYAFYLWYTNSVQVFKGIYSELMFLIKPTLEIKPKAPIKADHTMTLSATSTYFGTTKTCTINLISTLIEDPTSKDMYRQTVKRDYEWMESQGFKTTIPLGVEWVGPNINYLEPLPSDDTRRNLKFLGEVIHDDEGNALITYDEPQICDDFELHDAESENPWFWTEIIAIPYTMYNEFYMIHMDRSFRIVIYFCVPNFTDPNDVFCGSPIAEIEVGDMVVALAVGDFGDEQNVLAIASAGKSNVVDFYFIERTADHAPGDYWFPQRFNNILGTSPASIIDLELFDHTLYITLLGDEYYIQMSTYDPQSFIQSRGTISKADVDTWPIGTSLKKNFAPQKVKSSIYHSNIIFVQSVADLFVLNISGVHPMFVSFIPINAIKTYTFITERSLIVASNTNQLKDYSLVNLNLLQSDNEFVYQRYEYEYIQAFPVAQGKYSNLIYVLANTIGKNDLWLLVYRSGVENVRTLVKALQIEVESETFKLDNDGFTNISAGGYSCDYILVQYNMKKKWFRAPQQDSIVIEYQPVKENRKYVNDLNIIVEAHPWANNGKDFEIIEHNVEMVNTQTKIEQDEETISAIFGKGLFAKNEDKTFVAENVNEWYTGSVIDMSISCSPNPEVCEKNFYIRNQVEKQDIPKLEQIPKVIDMINVFDRVYQLAQDPNDPQNYVINMLDKELDLMLPYNNFSSNDDDLECYQMVETRDQTYQLDSFVVLCWSFKEKSQVAKIVRAAEDENQLDELNSTIYLKNLPENSVRKGEVYWFHSALFINSFYSESALYIYDIHNTTPGTGNLIRYGDELQVIKKINYEGDQLRLNIVSFFPTYEEITTQMGTQKFVKLFIADDPVDTAQDPHIYFLNLDTTDRFAPHTLLQRLDYRFFVVNKHKLFANSQTEIKRIQLLEFNENVVSGAKYLTEYKFIVMTSNTALYEFLVYFERSQTTSGEPFSYDSLISYISNAYNNYGDTLPIPQIVVENGAMAVPYYSYREDSVYYAIYNLFQDDDERRRRILSEEDEDDSHVPLHTLKGGIKRENADLNFNAFNLPTLDFVFYQCRDPSVEYPYLLITDLSSSKTLESFTYTPDTIAITTVGEFPKQSVSIHLNSLYATTNDAIRTEMDYGFPPDPPSPHHGGGSDTGLIIGLSVFFGLLLLGGVGFFLWWRKKKMSNGNSYFNKHDSTLDGMSMQEPLKKDTD